jgi:cold shock CspA family protein
MDVDTKLKGTVKVYFEGCGFGFLTRDDGSDVFFHISSVQGDYEPNAGDTVTYTLDTDRGGKTMASDVVIVT